MEFEITSKTAFLLTSACALLWLFLMERIHAAGLTSRETTRKLVHIGTGPIFVACWTLFPLHDPWARYWAALIPLILTARFALLGLGAISDPRTVQSMSRTGDPRELLRGPLCYGVIFVLSTLLWWTHSPLGLAALLVLCAGDGMADLVGRRFGGNSPLPWNRRKSLHGSLAFFAAALASALAFCAWFHAIGLLPYMLDPARLALVTLVGTLVESLPVEEWDNLTVFFAVVFSGYLVHL